VSIPKKKKTINGDFLLKYFVYLQHLKIKHQVNITQNISFLMIFFQKTHFFLEDELHYKLAQFEKVG